ncbi:MAG: CoA transferase, partial [Betaproteobacteria bacterium]|nr:CoA transferase [Betaproteobacteria bacterium]
MGGTLASGALAKLHCALAGKAQSWRLPVALHEAVQRMIEWQVPVASLYGRAEPRNGNNFPMNAGVSNMHRTADGRFVAISAANQAVAYRLLRMIGGDALAQDPRFDSPATRFRNMTPLYAILDAWIGARTLAEVEALA